MYIALLLGLLPFLGCVSASSCGRLGYKAICSEYPGVTYESCLNRPGNTTTGNGNSNGGGSIDETFVSCGYEQLNVLSSNTQRFHSAADVINFVITELYIPEGVYVKIGNLRCMNDDCVVMTLSSEAEAPVVFRIYNEKFRIHATGPGVILKFTCNSNDRRCKKKGGHDIPRKRMVNGIIAEPHEFPFMARLVTYYAPYDSPDKYESCNANGFVSPEDIKTNCANGNKIRTENCGGSIIHENWILSAAHCAPVTKKYKRVKHYLVGVLVIIGDHLQDAVDPERRMIWVTPSNIYLADVHNPSYLNNDVALLRVTPMDLDDHYRYPICLPPSYMWNYTFVGFDATSAGWGVEIDELPSNELRKGDFKIISNDECQSIFDQYSLKVTDCMMCTINVETHPCYGDGGGPTFCAGVDDYYYEIGILSFASTDITTIWALDEPNGNARITCYMQWIMDTISPDVLP